MFQSRDMAKAYLDYIQEIPQKYKDESMPHNPK